MSYEPSEYPEKTRVEKRIDKEKFYAQLDASPKLKRVFVSDVERVVVANVLTPENLELTLTSTIEEIDVVRVELKKRDFDPIILEQIARRVPRPILFCARYQDDARYAVYRRRLWLTESRPASQPPLELRGRTLDQIWVGFVEQTAIRDRRLAALRDLDLDAKLELQARVEKLDKTIAVAERNVKREKQPRVKFALYTELQKLKAERDALAFWERDATQ